MRDRNGTILAKRVALLVLAALCFAGAEANDARFDQARPDQARSGSLLLKMQQGYRVATTHNTDVSITVNGLVARVAVRQAFENASGEWAEGVYVFPLPDRAAVDRMRLHIGDRLIEGEIREKEQAKKEYRQAKAAGRKTSLVQQRRPNLFTTSLANIGPGERVIVEIEYLEDLKYEDGLFSLRFPMTLTPRYMPGEPLPDKQGSGWSADTGSVADASLISPPMVSASDAHRVAVSVELNAGMPLETISSRYHPVNVIESGANDSGQYAIELVGSNVRMDHDFELQWRPVASHAARAMAFVETIAGEPYYLLMVMPPSAELAPSMSMPREMLFIIDTSGSMHGTSIQQAKQALLRALARMRPGDRFNVIAFSSHAMPLFARSVQVDAGRLSAAERFVTSLRAEGGTEMKEALALALNDEPVETHLRQIVFITDGAVGNEDELFGLIQRKLGSGRMFTVGIGSAPNSWFMRKAAEVGRGAHTMISALNDVGERMDRLFEKIDQPQVTNISLAWPGGVIVDDYPETVPDLYVDEPVTVKAKISGVLQKDAVVTVSGDTMAGAWSRELPLAASDRQSPGVAALWARARIAALADERLQGGDADEVRARILATALKHHLVSTYTSLIAVDKTPSRAAGQNMRRDQVPNLMAYGQSQQAIVGFPATATAATRLQLLGAACIALSLLLMMLPRMRPARTRARQA